MTITTGNFKKHAWTGGVVLVTVLIGCVSVPPPEEQIGQTRSAIDAAEQAGAMNFAPVELRKAQRKLDEARTRMENEDYVTARRLAEQAQVDAELAKFKANSAKAETAADEVRQGIRTLRDELDTVPQS